jgi:hypothetical protein
MVLGKMPSERGMKWKSATRGDEEDLPSRSGDFPPDSLRLNPTWPSQNQRGKLSSWRKDSESFALLAAFAPQQMLSAIPAMPGKTAQMKSRQIRRERHLGKYLQGTRNIFCSF